MSATEAEAGTETDTLDHVVIDVRQLRHDAGQVSFAEIATRIAEQREAEGMSPAAARIARSSIHSMFTLGRQRMNADLLAEIVVALGEDAASAARWRRRCLDAQRMRTESDAVDAWGDQRPVDPPASPGGSAVAAAELPLRSPLVIALLLVACVGLNYFGNSVNAKFEIPLFLDMIGTAVAAIALGPWWGALVGLTSNALGAVGVIPLSLLFGIVNVAGALVWGYGVRAWRMKRPWWRFFVLNICVALVCTLIAVPINVIIFGGVADGHAAVGFVELLTASGEGLWGAVFTVNFVISVIDKLIAGYVALGASLLLIRHR